MSVPQYIHTYLHVQYTQYILSILMCRNQRKDMCYNNADNRTFITSDNDMFWIVVINMIRLQHEILIAIINQYVIIMIMYIKE